MSNTFPFIQVDVRGYDEPHYINVNLIARVYRRKDRQIFVQFLDGTTIELEEGSLITVTMEKIKEIYEN